MAKQHVFVIGMDAFNREQMRTIRGAENYEFHGLIPYHEIVNPEYYPIQKFLDEAKAELRAYGDRVDAVIGHWDFPTTSLLPIIRDWYGLPGPSLEAVLKCEHKYWSRVEQARVAPESTPAFQAVDPFDEDAYSKIEMRFPFWLKPTVAFSSYLAFRVRDHREFEEAIGHIREGIGKFAEPYDFIVEYGGLGSYLADYRGGLAIAEETIGGRQCTVEGYVYQGEPRAYGVIDSIRGPNRTSFHRYEYPSTLPRGVQRRVCDIAERMAVHLGLDNTAFNMEFFWDAAKGRAWLLEVNPRMSKSHAPLFEMVHGASHHEVAIDVALGRRPEFPLPAGRHRCAAKFMPRRYQDAVVTRAPSEKDIARVQAEFPDAAVSVEVSSGTQLSDLPNQDSYSYELGEIFLGGPSHRRLVRDYERIMEMLNFRFDTAISKSAMAD